jgi:hypothetical protein
MQLARHDLWEPFLQLTTGGSRRSVTINMFSRVSVS